MANPPITIGPFTNVPAPGSPIKSDWPQSLTNYLWSRYPRGFMGWGTSPSALNGIGNVDTDVPSMAVTLTMKAGRQYLILAQWNLTKHGAAGNVFCHLANAAGVAYHTNTHTFDYVGDSYASPMLMYQGLSGTDVATTFKGRIRCDGGGTVDVRLGTLVVVDIATGTPIT